MRVAFDIHTLGQQATGNETYAEGLMREFASAPPGDVDFVFYQTSRDPVVAAKVRRLRPAHPVPRLVFATPWALYRDRVDVAHFQYFAPPVAPCASVLTVHDLSFERHPEFFSRGMAWRMKTMMPGQVRRAAHVIAVSEATRRDLIELYGAAEDGVTVIHNGVSDFWRPLPDRSQAARTLEPLGIRRPFILATGNLGRRKNQVAVVRAYARIVGSRNPDIDLVLAGKATDTAGEILAEIDRSGLRDRIHVTGFVPREVLLALYNAAVCSVYLSHYEGFGLPILESMACATPCLTSAASCMPEVAGDAALLVDPGDDESVYWGLLRMMEDDALRADLSGAGLRRILDFSWKRAAGLTIDVYRRVLAGGGRRC